LDAFLRTRLDINGSGATKWAKGVVRMHHGGTESTENSMLVEEELTGKNLGAAIGVHSTLGLGLPESACEACLCHELALRRILFMHQVDLPVSYKGTQLSCGYGLELVVADAVVIELKAAERLLPIHEAQLLT
jgi:GxxExxY protein